MTSTAELPTQEVATLPRCQWCREQANLQTADQGPKLNICGLDNHPEYAEVPLIRLVLITAK